MAKSLKCWSSKINSLQWKQSANFVLLREYLRVDKAVQYLNNFFSYLSNFTFISYKIITIV